MYEYILTLAGGGIPLYICNSAPRTITRDFPRLVLSSLLPMPIGKKDPQASIMAVFFVPVVLRTFLDLLESKGNAFAPVRPWLIPSATGGRLSSSRARSGNKSY